MIFVTIGTYRFDELVQTIDRAIGANQLDEEVVMQIGSGYYQPAHCEYFRTAPSLDPYYGRAELVIGHGGTGTTMEVLERGLLLISVANPHLQDNHQHEFLEAMGELGYVLYCRDLAALPDLIKAVRRGSVPSTLKISPFFAAVSRELESWQPGSNSGTGWLRSLRRRVGSGRPSSGADRDPQGRRP